MNLGPRSFVVVFAVLLLLLAGSGTWFYRSQHEQVLRDAKAELDGIADSKANQLYQWRHERLIDATLLMENTLVASTAERWLAQPENRDTGEKQLLAQFHSLQDLYHFKDVLLVDTEGRVRLSLSGRLDLFSPHNIEAVSHALLVQAPELTDLHRSTNDAAPELEVVVPLHVAAAGTNRPVGALLLQVDARDFLYEVTQTWPSPSRTGETLFVRRDGENVLFLNALRRQPDAALKLRIPLIRTNVPAVMAVLGQTGVVQGVDYDGALVLAALRAVPDSPWFMVTKMDVDEALEEWRPRGILILAVLVLVGAALVGSMIVIGQQRIRNLELAQAVGALRESERRVRERTHELEESEERFRKLFADSAEAILLIENGRFIDCNRATLAALRMVSREQVCNSHPSQISPEFQPDGQRSNIKAEAMMVLAFEKGSHQFEWEHVRADGDRFLVEVLLTPIQFRNRRLLHVVWRDITEQRKAEKLRAQLSTIIESTSDFVATASPEGKILYLNHVARRMFGLSDTDDPASMTIARSHPAWAARKVLEEGFPTAIREGQWIGETAFLDHQGREIPHTQLIIAHKAANGTVELLSTVARDISEQKAAEAVVKARLRLMELSQTSTVEDFLQKALDEIEAQTGSTIGFYHFMDADQETLSLQAWSTNTLQHMCQAEGKGRHYPVSKAGVWCDCVRTRQPVIHNDYATLPHRQGLPPGHAPILRQVVVPVFRGDHIVAVIGVGNKPSPYGSEEVELVKLLGDFSWEIVERKRVEAQLHENAQRLQMLWQSVESSPAVVVITDTTGKIEYVNPKFLEVTGYTREEVLGQNPRVLKSGNTPASVYADMWSTLKAGRNWLGELCNKRKDGTFFWESATISPVENERGEIVNYLAIKEDITAKKQAQQEAAREAARQLRQKELVARFATSAAVADGLVEQAACELTSAVGRDLGIARVSVWLFNEDGTRLRCADLYAVGADTHSAGVELEETQFRNEFEALKQSNYIDAHDPLTDPRTAGYAESYLRPLGITSMLDAVVRSGGRTLGVVCLEHVNQPHHWEADEITFACQIADQISLTLINRARRRAEQELQRSVSLLQATLQSTADGILVVDRTGKITSFNQRFVELWRIPAETLESRDDDAALRHVLQQLKDPEGFVARVRDLYGKPELDSSDVLEFRDGRIYERHSRPQFVGGEPVGRVWSFRDVTAQRHAEAGQKRLMVELQRSNTDLEQFAYVASHDLKSPLRAIDSLACWLQEDLDSVLGSESRKHFALLRQRAGRMERLLDDLLAYSRAGQVPTDIALVSISQLVSDIAGFINLPAGFTVRLNGPAPTFATAATPLRTVLTNLINNAVKHHDREVGVVEVSVVEIGDRYEFTVADDGPGIPPEFHQRIWGMFQTLRPRDQVEGSGIGLALVQRIVTRYDGRVGVKCRQPRGTLFYFTWPKTIAVDAHHA